MTPTEYEKHVLATVVKLETVEDMLGLCGLGLAGEVGEVVEVMSVYLLGVEPVDRQRLQAELGDVWWYVALLCALIGISFEQVMSPYLGTFYGEMKGLVASRVLRAVVEVGCVCDLLKKHLYHGRGRPLDAGAVYRHVYLLMAALIYLTAYAGLTDSEVMTANVAKLNARHRQGFTALYASDSHASE